MKVMEPNFEENSYYPQDGVDRAFWGPNLEFLNISENYFIRFSKCCKKWFKVTVFDEVFLGPKSTILNFLEICLIAFF